MNKTHAHHDLIVKWLFDTSKDVVELGKGGEVWASNMEAVIADTEGDSIFKIKPREFIRGHWYPCILKGSTTNQGHPLMYTGIEFVQWECALKSWPESSFSHIGESLGEIKFGG